MHKAILLSIGTLLAAATAGADERPNFLFAIADDWGWPHASAYGDPVVRTPAFDEIARQGVLFHHAYVSSPSCTPSRNAILTGQWHWRLGSGANLWSDFPARLTTYPELLRGAGYQVGATGKAFGPGRVEPQGREVAGRRYKSFEKFLEQRNADTPFCYWLGSSDPHRPYQAGSGAESGMDLSAIDLPACFPDSTEVRSDVADYYWEVQRFDRLVGAAIAELKERGLWENTVVVMTGDHGMPFPRCKANLYDSGTRVPLAISWPAGGGQAGRESSDFVSLTDLAPTYLALAGVELPEEMTGQSIAPVLLGKTDEDQWRPRPHVLFGKERHTPTQEAPDRGGYPCRAIRTHDYLYIRNFSPDRWPNGTPNYQQAFVPGNWYSDSDNGPTKTYMVEHRGQDATHQRLFELAFAKRPAEELYDLTADPDQLHNVADEPRHADARRRLSNALLAELQATGDPRVGGRGAELEAHPYYGQGPKHPDWRPAPGAASGPK
ncbi:Arylsulfatase precursor [Posidoniimonas corsicana]|uniref:Arylsulfatase n=1 Tax=Posidoniimonas corsicana TaxID=1938618 RepID=A0A5C5VHM8_9BACT|nr:sulfatase [Posidoniimonas corsicana]TWT38086.1 Arylsulfatase precursor [Posidoniimonas corsicana]